MGNFSIGLDLGGTNLRAAAVDESGKMLDQVSGKTEYSAGREAIVRDMTDAIQTLRNRCAPHRNWRESVSASRDSFR